ncbi:MAG: HIT family protein [Rhodospirillales bacterium]
MRDPECIFCRIVGGAVPSIRVFEDDRTLAFMDINPANPGHVLVIPKAHAADIYAIDEPSLTATVVAARRVARAVRAALAPDGINIVQANGPGAAQSVAHFHWHVLPRRIDDRLALNWGLVAGDRDAIAAVAERLRDHL